MVTVDPIHESDWNNATAHIEQMGKEGSFKGFGEIAVVINTTHLFAHFRLTDFRETLQEYVNWYPRESFRREILIFFPLRRQFSPKIDFSVASMNFGVNNINKKPSCC